MAQAKTNHLAEKNDGRTCQDASKAWEILSPEVMT